MTREVALMKVKGYLTDYFSITDYNEVEEIMLALEQQPKIGRWIFCHPLQADDPGAYTCSVCGCGDWGLDPKIDKFCFNCGAKMIEPSENNE